MHLTEHFTLEALTQSHHGIDNSCPDNLRSNLQKVAERAEIARRVLSEAAGKECRFRVTYGYRCPAENTACGGSETSAHFDALAMDFVPDHEIFTLRQAWDILSKSDEFMRGVDQLITERGCVHFGLPTARHSFIARHELRLDQDVNGVRTYPLFGHWTPHGIEQVSA